jgi:predicted GNAT family acetyltransferase
MADAPIDDVRNDTAGNRFVIEAGGVEAELIYRKRAGRLILIHTEVPDALGGRGIGGTLVRAALAHARAEQLTIVPWCPFARRWLTDHPGETQDVTIDWDTLPPPTESSA